MYPNSIQSGATVKIQLLQLLRCMWHRPQQRLSIDRWLSLFVNHSSIYVRLGLFHIPILQHHNGILLWTNHGTKINGRMIHDAPNSKWAVHRTLDLQREMKRKKNEKNRLIKWYSKKKKKNSIISNDCKSNCANRIRIMATHVG